MKGKADHWKAREVKRKRKLFPRGREGYKETYKGTTCLSDGTDLRDH